MTNFSNASELLNITLMVSFALLVFFIIKLARHSFSKL